MAWRSMASLRPGTAEIEALRGRRVRAREDILGAPEFRGREAPFGGKVDVKAGAVGFVAASHDLGVAVALPHTPPGAQDRIDWLRPGSFTSVWLNLDTFLRQFELDA